MPQPDRQQQDALRALWMDGRGPIPVFMNGCISESIQTILDTEGKIRDEAAGQIKAFSAILEIMSGKNEAKPIKRQPDTTT